MAVQFDVATRNARLDAIETTWGASPKLKLFTGPKPASCAAANSGTELAHMDLPADPMALAANASKAKSGTWEDLTANNAGDIGHFRIYSNDGTTCRMQGTVTATGGGGDMTVDNINVAVGQPITVTGFTLIEGNG